MAQLPSVWTGWVACQLPIYAQWVLDCVQTEEPGRGRLTTHELLTSHWSMPWRFSEHRRAPKVHAPQSLPDVAGAAKAVAARARRAVVNCILDEVLGVLVVGVIEIQDKN